MAQTQLFDPFAPEPEYTDKDNLLHEMQEIWEPTKRLSFATLIISILGILLVSAVLMPKIYLRNSIYYESRDVTKLEHQYAILKQEKELLKAKVEAIRYQNQVEDTLF